jgi:hypothetical protein
MPASPTGFELQALQLIWQTALALTALSLLLPAALVLKRKYEDWRGAQRHERREELSRFILAGLRSPLPVVLKNLPELQPGDEAIIVRIVLDLLRVMRGNDRERLIQILRNWNLFPYLSRAARKGPRGKRIQAITLLGHFNDTESLVILMGHAGDTDIYVQLATLRCLAERGATKYIGPIVNELQKARKTNALMLADVLGRFGDSAIPSLVRLLQSGANADVRVAAIMALERIGSLSSIDPLLKILHDENAEVRAQAASTLGKLGDVRAGAALTHCLVDAGRNVRLQAAIALGSLSYHKALPYLVKAMNDSEWWVRFRAAQALYKAGNNGIAMLKSLSRTETEAGMLAAQVLGEMGGHDARHPAAA